MNEKIEKEYPQARQHIEWAQNSFDYTLTIIDGSSNRLSDEEQVTEKGLDIMRRVNLMREDVILEKEFTLGWIQVIAASAFKYRVGNCCEKACTVFNHLYKNINSKCNLELFNNPFMDHFFVVLGRDPGTNPIDPGTWNADTIICDPWIEDRCYYIGEINFENLKDNKREVINYLLSYVDSAGPLILQKDVLGKANGLKVPIILKQPCMVLRTSSYKNCVTSYNTNIPVTYESWDFPEKKHYKKHERAILANRFFLVSLLRPRQPQLPKS